MLLGCGGEPCKSIDVPKRRSAMNLQVLAREVDRNYDFFQRHMSEYLPLEFGRYALLRHGQVLGFFDSADAAEEQGEQFEDGIYSIQLVDPAPIDLGAFSNG
jgi:hypothetical protein